MSNFFSKFVKLWLPVLIWASFIFYLSAVPYLSSGLEKFWDVILRKIGHIFVFAVLFLLLARPLKKSLKWALILSLLYAVSDEWHQSFTPGRSPGLADLCFDFAGVFLGYLFWPLILESKYKFKKFLN
jgi:VanZ family protein